MDLESYPLSMYDEYPVHQTPYPFSYMPNGELSYDEGYFWGICNPEDKLYLIINSRITPNVDVISGQAGLSRNGVQRSIRLSREWRRNMVTELGPFRYDFTRPMQENRLVLEENEANLSFDVKWLALGPPHLSSHHLATQRGRRTTDQSRYNQTGTAEGWIRIDDEHYEVTPDKWFAVRDHSWGVYEGRPPYGGHVMKQWLPPVPPPKIRRALRLSMFFVAEAFNGYFHVHEDENGEQHVMNDAFGTPFEGVLDFGFERRLELTNATHKLTFRPGTRSIEDGKLEITDAEGGIWKVDFKVTMPPVVIIQSGYHIGSWKDGGNQHTWHGDHDPYIEWDEFDFSNQPTDHVLYGETEPRKVHGVEHIGLATIAAPDGTVHQARHHTEIFLNGRYKPYGIEPLDMSRPHGLLGRGII